MTMGKTAQGLSRSRCAAAVMALLLTATAGSAAAQGSFDAESYFKDKTIRLIVPSSAGGGADIGPSVEAGAIPAMSLEVDGNYFLLHHTPADTVDKIEQRVNHDLYYIENWSILLDAYIVFMTPFRLFNSENAY